MYLACGTTALARGTTGSGAASRATGSGLSGSAVGGVPGNVHDFDNLISLTHTTIIRFNINKDIYGSISLTHTTIIRFNINKDI